MISTKGLRYYVHPVDEISETSMNGGVDWGADVGVTFNSTTNEYKIEIKSERITTIMKMIRKGSFIKNNACYENF